jgi:YfiH family protein
VSEGPFESLNLGFLTEDERERVTENHERVAALAGVRRGSILRARQVHGTRVRHADAPPEDVLAEEADGHMTTAPRTPALVLVADCLPIALAGAGGVAMLHAGWRGLSEGILHSGVLALRERRPLAAAIGPGIGPCCYEVGDEVLRLFPDEVVAHDRNLDLKAAARRTLERLGVEEIHDCGLCTSCEPELFFSHRRDQGVTGRQGGLVWRN